MSDNLPTIALARGPCSTITEMASRHLEEYLDKIDLATEHLSDPEIWWHSRPHANSIGNLILHLHGNLSLWIRRTLGELPFERRRSSEFAADKTHTKGELLALLAEAIRDCREILEETGADDLGRPVTVQGYDTNVLGVVFHAVEHMSYHTGQIVSMAKNLADADLFEFYPQHADE